MLNDSATAIRCAIAALILIIASVAALTTSHGPDQRSAIYRPATPKQIVADSHRAFAISARQP